MTDSIDTTQMSNDDLELFRDRGMAIYLSSYVRLMTRALELDDSDNIGVAHMASLMVEPMNIATEAIWRAMMEDKPGEIAAVLGRFKESLNQIGKGAGT